VKHSAVFGVSMTSLSAIIAACGGEEAAPPPPPAAPPAETEAPPAAPPPAETEAEPPPPAGPDLTAIINLGLESDLDSLDPQAFKTVSGYHVTPHIYNSIGYHPWEQQGELLVVTEAQEFDGLIATAREVSPDFTSMTYTIRTDAVFEDGSPVTMDDVLYTFERALGGAQYTSVIAPFLRLDETTPFEALDDTTIRFNASQPSPIAPLMLGMVVYSIQQRAAGEANKTAEEPFADSFWRENAISNGPYLFKNWQRGTGFDLEPNPTYFAPERRQNGGIAVRIITDPQQRLNLLKSGDLHIVNGVSPKDAVALQDDPESNAKVLNAPSPWNFMLYFDNNLEPFNKKEVRQALSYAIPYDTIVNEVMFGLGRPALGMIPPGMPTHDPTIWPYATDLQKAKELLTAAGYPDGFESKIVVLLGRAQDENAATFIQSNFQQIGVNVQIEPLLDAEFQATRVEGKAPMFIDQWLSWVNDPGYHFFWNLYSKSTFTNNSHYVNPEFDKILDENLYETDAAKREGAMKELQRISIDDAPVAWLYAQDFYWPVSKNLVNLIFTPDQLLRLGYASLMSA
jgi:peptide/nickel transport system substrate-binding protein